MDVLYNCIADLEEERKIIIDKQAISIFKKYVENNSELYLCHFIRPYYKGPTKDSAEYYLHISEPFCEQIFSNGFTKFLDNIPDEAVDRNLVNDIRFFYEKANGHPNNTDKVVMLFSNDNLQSLNRMNHLKLLSDKHIYVRQPCMPPKYQED